VAAILEKNLFEPNRFISPQLRFTSWKTKNKLGKFSGEQPWPKMQSTDARSGASLFASSPLDKRAAAETGQQGLLWACLQQETGQTSHYLSVKPLIIPGFLMSFMNFPLTLNRVLNLMRPKSRRVSWDLSELLCTAKWRRRKQKKKKKVKTAIKVANESRRRNKIVLRCCD